MITDFIGTLFGSGSKSFSLSHPAADEKENFSEKEDQLHLNVITEPHLHDTPTCPAEDEVDEDDEDIDLNQMTLVNLRKLADKRGIIIPKAFKKKAQIVELLQNPSMQTDDAEETEAEPEKGSKKRKASSVASTPISVPTTRRSLASMDSQDESKNKKRKAGSGLALKTSSSTSPSTQRTKHSPYKLRTPKQLAQSHDRALDSAYDYYAVDKHVPSPPHQLRTDKELRKTHKNALDPNYVYAPQAHSASPHGKRATATTSTRKSSRSTAGRSRASSCDETPPKLKSRSAVKKSPVSRRKSGRRSVAEPEESDDDDDETSVASSRFQDTTDPMLKMVKGHSIKSHPSEMDVDSESQQENHDNNSGRQRGRGRSAGAADNAEKLQNQSASKRQSAKIQKAEQEDTADGDDESEEVDVGYSGGDDMNMDVEGEEPNGTLDDNEDENDDNEEEQSDLGDDDMQNIHAALSAHHDGTESQMDERLTLISSSPERTQAQQNNSSAKKPVVQHEDVMDLVSSSDDEAESAPTQPVAAQQQVPAPVSVAAPTTTTTTAAHDASTPALKAVKHLASRLEAAAMQLENNLESQAPISEKEYDIIRNFLEKIKPPTVAGESSAAKTAEEPITTDPVSMNKKRVSIDPTSPMVVDDTGMPFSTSKRRRDDDGFPIPSARPSYDGGSWRSRESFLPDMSTASPANNGLPSIAGNLFGRASFGAAGLVTGSVYGRQQTPYNKSYRPTFSEEKEALTSSSGPSSWYQPPLTQPLVSSVTSNVLNGFQGARPLGSGRPLSAGSFNGSAQKQTPGYTPQFRGSSASFSLQSRDSTESSRAGDESSLSYLERRKLKRLSEASVSASVAHQILETLGNITSPDPAQRSSSFMADETKMLKGTVTIPQFLTRSQKQQQQQKEAAAQGKPKQVSFAPAESVKAPAVESSNQAASAANDRMEVSDKEELEDIDEIVMTKRSRSFASSSSDAEFPFDEPMVVQGVEDVELPHASSKDIKYTFTPPSKRKKPQQEAGKAIMTVPVQKAPAAMPAPSNVPINNDKRVPETPAASAPPVEMPSIWTVKAKGKKCPHCMVMNKEDASRCASCEQPLEGGAGGFGAPIVSSASNSNAFTPAKGFGVGLAGATPAAISFGTTPAPVPAGGSGAISAGGFMFGGAPPAADAAPAAKEADKPALAPAASSVGFSFSAPAPAAAPITLKVDNAPLTGFTASNSIAAEDPSQAASKPIMPFEFKLRASEGDKPALTSALPSFGGAPESFGAASFSANPPQTTADAALSLDGGRGRDRDEDEGDGPSRKRRNNESSFSSGAVSAGDKAFFSGASTESNSTTSKDEPPKSVNALPSFGGFGAVDSSTSSKSAGFSMAFPAAPSTFSGFGASAVVPEAAKKEEVQAPVPAVATAPSLSVAPNIFASSFAPTAALLSQPAPSSTSSALPAPFIFGSSKPAAASVPAVITTALVPVPSFPALTSTTSGGSTATLPLPAFGTSTSGGSNSTQPQPFSGNAFGAAAFGGFNVPKKAEETPQAPATPAFHASAYVSQPAHAASTPTFGSSGDGMDTGSNLASPLVMGNPGPPLTGNSNSAISTAPLFGSGITGSAAPATGGFTGFGSKPSLPSGIAGFSQPTLTSSQSIGGGFGTTAPSAGFGNAPTTAAPAPFMFGGSSAPAPSQSAPSGGFAGFGGSSTGGFPAVPSDMSGGIFATSTSHAQQPAGGNIFGFGGSSTGNLQQSTGGSNPMFGGAAPPSSAGFGNSFASNPSFQSIPGPSLQNQVSAAVGLPPGGNGNPFGSGNNGSTGFSLGTVNRSNSSTNLAGRKILKASVKKKTG